MLKAQGLVKKYGSLAAVDGVSLEIASGGILGLLGPNGAGKTTTISMICGLRRPDAGNVEIDGIDLFAHPWAAKMRLGFCPQETALYDDLSALDNLAFFGGLYGMRGSALAARSAEMLGFAGLSDRARHKVSTYSGGMKRRLNIAVALMHDPGILLLDEPTAGVDPQSRNAIFESIASLKGKGKSILYTTHYMEEAQRLCDRIAVMDRGKVLALGTFEELLGLVGSKDRITVRCEGGADAVRSAAEALAADGLDARAEGGVLAVLASDSGAALSRAAAALDAAGAKMTAANIDKPTLESVFLHLTGRRLRD